MVAFFRIQIFRNFALSKQTTMQIPLSYFEEVIDETILKRGLSYFKDGKVQEPKEVGNGIYEAVVEGTEDYTVRLKIKNNVVMEHSCDCPYDRGPVCKHVAAVIFALQEDKLALTEKPSGKKKARTKSPKRKSAAAQIDELLSKATRDELEQLIREEAKRDADFKNQILMALEHYNENLSQYYYEQQIKAILKASKGRYGFLDYHGSIAAGLAVGQMLDTARNHIGKRNFQNALYICFAVLEKMGAALNEADDSNGDMGGCISEACEMLYDIAKVNESEALRKQIFDWCVSFFEKGTLEDWDWHTDILELAAEIVNTRKEFDRIIALTEQEPESKYTTERLQNIKYKVLMKMEGESVAEAFLEQQIANPEFRRMALQKALDQNDFAKAYRLAEDGVKHDMQKYPGLAMEWYDWMLKTAQTENNVPKIIEYARYLLIDHFRHGQDYYQILKQHVAPEKWTDFVEELLRDINKKKRWDDEYLIAKIYINEEWWDRLWEMVRNANNLSTTERYESYLSKDYAKELADLYVKLILVFMENNVGRTHYMNACRYIRHIIKLGEREKADKVIATLRTKYSNRRALMEELNKV